MLQHQLSDFGTRFYLQVQCSVPARVRFAYCYYYYCGCRNPGKHHENVNKRWQTKYEKKNDWKNCLYKSGRTHTLNRHNSNLYKMRCGKGMRIRAYVQWYQFSFSSVSEQARNTEEIEFHKKIALI